MPAPHPHSLTYGVNAKLHPAQLAWLRLQAAESETSVSEEIRSAVWSAILNDPHAADVVGEDVLLDLVRDDPEGFVDAPALQPLKRSAQEAE